MQIKLIVTGIFLLSLVAAPARAGGEGWGKPITENCADLPFDSFPPNQLPRLDNPDGTADSLLQAAKAGVWGEYFIEVDQPGTYRVDVQLLKGQDKGIFRLVANGEAVGEPVDCHATGSQTPSLITVGNVTFLKPDNYCFRFLVTGKNSLSSGYGLTLRQITLTPARGFTLLAPNGSCEATGDVLLRWNPWPGTKEYRVEVDGATKGTLDGSASSWQAANLSAGRHWWRVIAIAPDGRSEASNTFSFEVGTPLPYPCREFTDNFSSAESDGWELNAMELVQSGANHCLQAGRAGSAVRKSVSLDKTEGELAARVTPGGSDSAAGLGFQSDDGTQLYAVADLTRNELRIERKLVGPMRYSIFDVTPKAYWVRGWKERTEGNAIVWEIASKPITVTSGSTYTLKFAYSRRSGCVMATLDASDGSDPFTLRDLTDLRTPDHPLLVSLSGKASYGDVSLRLLNKHVYKWDPDSTRIVLRPGEPGAWDEKGAFNPAVVVRDGTWHMVYRGNAKAAPPSGPPASDLGLATSTDGVHWTKSAANPIVRKEDARDSKEDPDLIWPNGSNQVYLEYVSHHPIPLPITSATNSAPPKKGRGELMCSSSDFIHWSQPWFLNGQKTFGKMGGFIDTQSAPNIPEIQFNGSTYRYVSMIEEGRIDLSHDLHQWIKAGVANLKGSRDTWCTFHECSGDIFVDADKNIRFESQIGVQPEAGKGGAIVGNRLCTIGEGALDGTDPTKVLWRSDLPWLTDWYGDAPTGAPENYTATNGSVFPGQTVVHGGWLWHYSGGNNHCTLLTKCRYAPVLECRDLQAATNASGRCTVHVVVRNTGSLDGAGTINLSLDGTQVVRTKVNLKRDTETTVNWEVPSPAGVHTLSVDNLSLTIRR